jgi:hypothetical protein
MYILKKQYIRDDNRNPIGLVVALKSEKGITFGYSLCNPKDHFDKKSATLIAVNRASHYKISNDEGLAPLVPERRERVLEAYERLSLYLKPEELFDNSMYFGA